MEQQSRSDTGVRPEDLVGWTLVQAYKAMAGRFHETFADLGLTAHQFGVLVRLNLQPGASQAAMAREVFVTPQSMGPIVQHLVADGLVRRVAPVTRGAASALELTDAGRKKLAVAFPRVAAINAPEALGLSPDEAVVLNELLHRVRVHLQGREAGRS